MKYSCAVSLNYDVVFVKSTIFKSKIKNQATTEIKKLLPSVESIFPRRVGLAKEILQTIGLEPEEAPEVREMA